jgi:hypothetical protein
VAEIESELEGMFCRRCKKQIQDGRSGRVLEHYYARENGEFQHLLYCVEDKKNI